MPEAALQDVAAVIVHHRTWDRVAGVAADLAEQGVATIVVVDNSEQPELLDRLRGDLPPGADLVATSNAGYAAAVNAGLRHLAARTDAGVEPPEFVLVATHEIVAHRGAVAALRSALRDDPTAAAAGPTLLSPAQSAPAAQGDRVVWSRGGRFTPVLHRPAHVDHRSPWRPDTDVDRLPVAREWVDGACVLYRHADLLATPLSERFFLYMEETDQHLRLGRAGRRVLWVPSAVVEQESNGTPPYWFARNLGLLFRRNLPWWRALTLPVIVGRAIAAAAVRRDVDRVRALARGLAAGLVH